MLGNGEEAVVAVEARRRIVDGVHHHEPGSCGVAGGHGLAERLGEQLTTDALPVSTGVHRQSGQQSHGDGWAGSPRKSLRGTSVRSTEPMVRLKSPRMCPCSTSTNVRAESICWAARA